MSNEEKAERLDHVAELVKKYARILRGEKKDHTGLGVPLILKMQIELAMGWKICMHGE